MSRIGVFGNIDGHLAGVFTPLVDDHAATCQQAHHVFARWRFLFYVGWAKDGGGFSEDVPRFEWDWRRLAVFRVDFSSAKMGARY